MSHTNGRHRAKLQHVTNRALVIDSPIVELVPGRKRAYLWIGNNGVLSKRCYGTLSGEATLRKLAEAILAELDGKRGRG